ncbi:TPA: hypothetical protein ACP32N_006532 [Pseudomonas aeruginosa]
MPEESAAATLAAICGFGTWDVMAYAMETLPPSVADEDLEPEQLHARLKNQFRILVQELEMSAIDAVKLLGFLPPLSKTPLQPFTPKDATDLTPEQFHAFDEIATELADALEEQLPPDLAQAAQDLAATDPYRSEVAFALSEPVFPDDWVSVFSVLRWDYNYLVDVGPDFDEPSFTVSDKCLGEIPVYLSPLIWAPLPQKSPPYNRAVRVQRAVCVGDYLTNWKNQSSVALLLQRQPVVKEIDGHLYCHLGSIYQGELNQWTDLLFNRHCTSVSTLLKLNAQVTSFDHGCPELADEGDMFSKLATICLAGVNIYAPDALSPGSRMIMRSNLPNSSWAMQQVVGGEEGED